MGEASEKKYISFSDCSLNTWHNMNNVIIKQRGWHPLCFIIPLLHCSITTLLHCPYHTIPHCYMVLVILMLLLWDPSSCLCAERMHSTKLEAKVWIHSEQSQITSVNWVKFWFQHQVVLLLVHIIYMQYYDIYQYATIANCQKIILSGHPTIHLQRGDNPSMATGLILGLRPANERRRYKVTPSVIGWVQSQNQTCGKVIFSH